MSPPINEGTDTDLTVGPLQSSANINCDRGRFGACLISRLNKSKCYTAGHAAALTLPSVPAIKF